LKSPRENSNIHDDDVRSESEEDSKAESRKRSKVSVERRGRGESRDGRKWKLRGPHLPTHDCEVERKEGWVSARNDRKDRATTTQRSAEEEALERTQSSSNTGGSVLSGEDGDGSSLRTRVYKDQRGRPKGEE